MARLATTGFETGHASASAVIDGFTYSSTIGTVGTTNARLGIGRAYAVTPSGGQIYALYSPQVGASQADVFFRFYVLASGTPSANTSIIGWYNGSQSSYVHWRSDNKLQFTDFGGNVTATASALTTGVWYRVDVRLRIGTTTGNGQFELRVDGTNVASSNAANMGTVTYASYFCNAAGSTSTGAVFYFDDMGVNDASGASQNSWLGDGKVIHLQPVSDNAVGTGWTVPGGGTTNLYDAVNNVPPIGIADSTSSADAGKQIRNPNATTTANYDATLQSYTAAGVGASDAISLVQPYAWVGRQTATCNVGIAGVSNPSVSEVAANTLAANAGTFPSNWQQRLLPVTYAPAVTLGTGPVVRAGKRTSSVTLLACSMGMLVEYIPSSATPVTAASTAALAIGAAGAPTAPTAATGTAATAITSSGAPTAQIAASATAAITATASGQATVALQASSTSPTTVTAQATGKVTLQATSASALSVSASGAATAPIAASSTAAITVQSSGLPTATLKATSASAIQVAATGAATTTIVATGTATVTVTTVGGASVPGILQAAGTATISITSSGTGAARLVATGSAVITTAAQAAGTTRLNASSTTNVTVTTTATAQTAVAAASTAPIAATASAQPSVGQSPTTQAVVTFSASLFAEGGLVIPSPAGSVQYSTAGGVHAAPAPPGRIAPVVGGSIN